MKSVEGQQSSSEILCREIRDQSQKEIEEILDQAEKEAHRILKDAKIEAETIRADILKKAHIQADEIHKKILSGVHLELKRKVLQAREEVLLKIFGMVENKLSEFRKSKEYGIFLKKLMVECIIALNADSLQVIAGDVERKLLTVKFLSEVEKEVHKNEGRKIKLILSDQTFNEEGVVLSSSDGRIRFDNRFSTRMRRMQDEMRLLVVKDLGI